jgi:hypothetical protein
MDPIVWEAIDWHHQSGQERRLRQRIFKAAQAGDHKQVRNLQKQEPVPLENSVSCGDLVFRYNAANQSRSV